MKTAFVDLHLHTDRSDGADPPSRVVERAAELGFAAIAITDHDTVAGVDEAGAAAQKLNMEFINGVEISATLHGAEVHVVGLGILPCAPPLEQALADLRKNRIARAHEIMRRLNELGIPIDAEQVSSAHAGAIGRMHIAKELQALGHVKTVQAAFTHFIGRGRPAFVPQPTLPCEAAIQLVHDARGLAILAHPGLGKAIKKVLPALLEFPFDGIEVYHSSHSANQTRAFTALADARGLLVSGGSDCHGTIKGAKPDMGSVRVPYHCFARIKERIDALNAGRPDSSD